MRITNFAWLALLALLPASRPEAAGSGGATGTIVVLDKGKKVDAAKLVEDDEVYVYLEPVGRRRKRGTSVSGHTIKHEKLEFKKHINVVPVGTHVQFPNNDPNEHNAFSNTPKHDFDFGVYKGGSLQTRTFPSPGEIEIFCDIHPQMWAIVKVIDSEWYAPVKNGSFSISNVPAGTYRAVAWMRASGESRSEPFTISDGQVTTIPEFPLQKGQPRLTHQRKDGSAYPPY